MGDAEDVVDRSGEDFDTAEVSFGHMKRGSCLDRSRSSSLNWDEQCVTSKFETLLQLYSFEFQADESEESLKSWVKYLKLPV